MAIDNKKKKKYEPPSVIEIGGVFEQAFGLTCTAGGSFAGGSCANGISPASGGCTAGPQDVEACKAGAGNYSKCARGTGVGG
jgi:hypothetical protein